MRTTKEERDLTGGRSRERILLAALVIALGCAPPSLHRAEPFLPSVDAGTVTIQTIDPPISTGLRKGARVRVSVSLDYELKAPDTGEVALVVQDQSGRSLVTGEQARVPVTRGKGQATLTTDVEIPQHWVSRVVVCTPLMASGVQATDTVDRAEYRVVK